jgi:hypothetical protein
MYTHIYMQYWVWRGGGCEEQEYAAGMLVMVAGIF